MAWIDMVDEEKAEGKLAKLYDKLSRSGKNEVAHVLKVQSLNPDLLADHLKIYKTIMFASSNISRRQREMIATVVSDVNECHYWITHHGEALQKLIRDDEQADKILNGILDDYKTAPISKKEKSMLDYAVKLTKKPASIKKDDLNQLREFDLSDRDILDLNQIVAYFNYVNRTADGLGIELEANQKLEESGEVEVQN